MPFHIFWYIGKDLTEINLIKRVVNKISEQEKYCQENVSSGNIQETFCHLNISTGTAFDETDWQTARLAQFGC